MGSSARRRGRRAVVFAAALWCAATASAKDTLVFVDGSTRVVDGIVEANTKQVRVRGGDRVDPRGLLWIEHGDAPAAFAAGEAALRAGQFRSAVQQYEAALAAGGPDWVPSWSTVRIGEALSRAAAAGDRTAAERAITTLERFLADNPDHVLEPRALRALGQAQLAADRASDAEATFQRLADRKYGEYWEMWGKLGLGRALLAQGKYTDALQQLEPVIQFAKTRKGFGEILGAAQAAKGEAFVAKGDYDEAIRFYEELARSGKGTSAQSAAGAFVNLGKAYEKRGRGDDRRRALMVYRRVAIYYAGAPGAYAEALLRAGKLLEAEGRKDEAAAFYRELKARCPESPQASQVGG
ncbi:MAG: hypothetical protein D6776_07865, partial [Planctomycetota bacterium]